MRLKGQDGHPRLLFILVSLGSEAALWPSSCFHSGDVLPGHLDLGLVLPALDGVLVKNVLPVVGFITILTHERPAQKTVNNDLNYLLDTEVASHVVLQVALSPEADAAVQRARVRPLLLVDKHVSLQMLLLHEVFAATFLSAPVRLHPVDELHVNLVLLLLVEFHAADGADCIDL